jgi:preprotein translocase subunit Sss1
MNDHQKDLVQTARITGVWYLILAIAGVVGFLVIHPQVYVSGDLEQTVINLHEQETLARLRLLAEFVIVVSQALAAVYFFKLFKDINHFASWALAAWGMMNAGVIMISAIAMGGAINLSNTSLPLSDKLIMIQVFDQVIKNAWGVGSLFFGLWLIPMGYIVVSSKRMPIWLGRILILGGIGYIVSAFLNYGGFHFSWIDVLTIPATLGEFWIIGYLLVFGIRPQQ